MNDLLASAQPMPVLHDEPDCAASDNKQTDQAGKEPASFKIEVIADGSGKWCGNDLRFATAAEAEGHAKELSSRWLAVREWRVEGSEDPVTYKFEAGRATPI
jgi:hypothetical protein